MLTDMVRAALLALLLVLVGGVACGSSRPRIVTFAGQLPEPVVPLAWLEGRWDQSGGGAVEHWSAAGPAMFGVSFVEGVEVLVVDAPDGRAQLTQLVRGAAAETLPLASKGKNFATFGGEAHRVRYERRRGQLLVTVGKQITRFDRRDPEHSVELDDADRRWATADAVDVGAQEIAALAVMERHVVASAPAPVGDVGFTIGLYRSADGRQRGAYIAIWEKDGTRGWTLRFATARATS